MLYSTNPPATDWTAADLVAKFGAMPLARVRFDPPPGLATERDVEIIHNRDGRLCELFEGTLLEKTMGWYESYLAILLARLLGNFVVERKLGLVSGEAGLMRLRPGLVRIPDVAFTSWQRLANLDITAIKFLPVAPDLAAEIISEGNTAEEMNRKLAEYFEVGVRLVWYVYPTTREFHVYTSSTDRVVLKVGQTLDGGAVLPGFSLDLQEFFDAPSG